MLFPSEAWLRSFVAAANEHPDLPRALSGLGPDLAAVVEAEPPALERPFAAHGRQEGGRIVAMRVLDDPDDILELAPSYVLRAPYGIWKSLILGGDPVRAVLSGQVRVSGDLAALVRRAGYRYVVDAALAAMATKFVDEERGTWRS